MSNTNKQAEELFEIVGTLQLSEETSKKYEELSKKIDKILKKNRLKNKHES